MHQEHKRCGCAGNGEKVKGGFWAGFLRKRGSRDGIVRVHGRLSVRPRLTAPALLAPRALSRLAAGRPRDPGVAAATWKVSTEGPAFLLAFGEAAAHRAVSSGGLSSTCCTYTEPQHPVLALLSFRTRSFGDPFQLCVCRSAAAITCAGTSAC